MSKRIEEVSHRTTGGLGDYLTFGLVTGGVGLLTPIEPERHEVVVRDTEGNYGVSKGSSHQAARESAIRDLSNGNKSRP